VTDREAARSLLWGARSRAALRFDGFDDKILRLYARGMTVREIREAPGRTLRHVQRQRPAWSST